MNISFIIPVYNTSQNKLIRCFESIKQIEGINYEVIVIDDGSQEETAQFCINYINNYDSFHYIKKTNGGVSSARNLGIKTAQNDYIYFCDSDDEINYANFSIFKSINDVDICFTDVKVYMQNKEIIWKAFAKESSYISIVDVLERMTIDGKLNGPYCKLIKKEFLLKNDIRFNENMITGEDALFLLQMLKYYPNMYYIDEVTYHYYLEENTSYNRLMSNVIISINNNVTMFEKKVEMIKKINTTESFKELLIKNCTSYYIKQLFNITGVLSLNNKLSKAIKKHIINNISIIDQGILKKCNFKARLQYIIMIHGQWYILKFFAFIRLIYLKNK